MKKIFAIVVVLLTISVNAHAQQKASSINIGFAPFGNIQEKISLKDEKYKYNYKSYWGAVLGLENQLKGVTSLTEITYSSAKFDKYDLTGVPVSFNPYQTEDIQDFTLIQYFGKTINPNKRVQFPLYVGIGGEYILGGPLHNLAIDGAAKARVKFFITNKIGIYAGGNIRYGYGTKKADEDKSSKSNYYWIGSFVWHIDAGLTIGL